MRRGNRRLGLPKEDVILRAPHGIILPDAAAIQLSDHDLLASYGRPRLSTNAAVFQTKKKKLWNSFAQRYSHTRFILRQSERRTPRRRALTHSPHCFQLAARLKDKTTHPSTASPPPFTALIPTSAPAQWVGILRVPPPVEIFHQSPSTPAPAFLRGHPPRSLAALPPCRRSHDLTWTAPKARSSCVCSSLPF